MRIANDHLILDIDDATGALRGLYNGRRQFLSPGERPLFFLRLRDAAGAAIDVCSDRFTRIRVSYYNGLNGERAVLMDYSGYPDLDLRVAARVTLAEGDTQSRWSLSLDNGTGCLLEWLEYPVVRVPHDFAGVGGDMRLLWPCSEGALISDASLRERSEYYPYKPMEFPAGGWTGIYPGTVGLQMMAYYGPQGGLYFAAHDPQDHLKAIEYFCEADGVRLMIKTFCDGPTAGWSLPFPMVLGVFEGDWHAAAERYRAWYESAPLNRPAKLASRQDLPDWQLDSPVVVGFPIRGQKDTGGMDVNPEYFPLQNALPYLARVSERANSRVMTLLMHWEGTAPWAPPYVWPPFGGEEAFRAFVDALHARHDLVGVYCSGIGYTMQSAFRADYDKTAEFQQRGYEEIMCLPPDRRLPLLGMGGIRAGYEMCPTCPEVTEICAGEIQRIAAAGVDYAQFFDQNLGGAAYACYSDRHGHPAVPGRYRNEACLNLFRALNRVAQEWGHLTIGCEVAAAQPFIGELTFNELRYFTLYDIGEPVPLYQYVFHEYLGNFSGNQITAGAIFDPRQSPDNLAMRLAYAFVAGEQFMLLLRDRGRLSWGWLTDWSEPDLDEEAVYTLVSRMNAWRRARPEYLLLGRMVAPLPLRCAAKQYPRRNGGPLSVPAVLHSAWQTFDGQTAHFLVNYTAQPQQVTLPTGSYQLQLAPGQEARPVREAFELPAHTAAMLL